MGRPRRSPVRVVGVSASWFYKWRNHTPPPRDLRRVTLDTAIKGFFDVSVGTYGSAQIPVELRETGWVVSAKTVAASMARQNLVARSKKKKGGLTRALEAKRQTSRWIQA